MQPKKVGGKIFCCPTPVQGDLLPPSFSAFSIPPLSTKEYQHLLTVPRLLSLLLPPVTHPDWANEPALMNKACCKIRHSVGAPWMSPCWSTTLLCLFFLYFSLSMAKLIARELKAPFLAMPQLYNLVLLGGVWRRLLGHWKTGHTNLRIWYVWGQIHACACYLERGGIFLFLHTILLMGTVTNK